MRLSIPAGVEKARLSGEGMHSQVCLPPPPVCAGIRASPLSTVEGGREGGGGACPLCRIERASDETERGKVSPFQSYVAFGEERDEMLHPPLEW